MKEDFIIFIQWLSHLPDDYPIIVDLFRPLGIRVLPIKYDQLTKYRLNTYKIVLSITPDLVSTKIKLETLRRSLNFPIKIGRLTFFDLSSYSNLNTKLEYFRESYKFFPLPMKYIDIVQLVASHFYTHSSSERYWPGGRKSKLPYDVLEK